MAGNLPGSLSDVKRITVDVSSCNPVDAADMVRDKLLELNESPWLFSMPPSVVCLAGDGTIVPLDPDGWLNIVARVADFMTVTAKGGARLVAPPAAVMRLVPAAVMPELPVLDGVASMPYLDRDGTLASADGYHPGTRLLLRSGGLDVPEVSAAPSGRDVAAAAQYLAVEWLGDFPFAGPADRAAAIAVLLTLTGRMFFSLAPLFVFDASTSGAGKGLLISTTSVIATGEPPQIMELPADGEEQRKKVTTAVLGGRDLLVWDEMHVIAGRSLAAVLTAERYADRLLGANKMITVANKFTQVALGNNVEVRGDLKRRVWPCRLVPDTEHPEHRTGFRHPDLLAWVRVNRGNLLWAVLTIWRNWVAGGRPPAAVTLGSFETWGRAVGGALEAAGIIGFGAGAVGEWLSYSEEDDGGWGEHLAELRRWFGRAWFTVSDVDRAVARGMRLPPVKYDPAKQLPQQLAYSYRKVRDKWHGDLRLIRSGTRDSGTGGRTWTVQHRDDGQDAQDVRPDEHVRPGTEQAFRSSSSPSSSVTDDHEHGDHVYPCSVPGAPDWQAGSISAQAGVTGQADTDWKTLWRSASFGPQAQQRDEEE